MKSKWKYPIKRWTHGKQTKEPVLRPEPEIYLNRRGGNGSNVWAVSQTAQKKKRVTRKEGQAQNLGQ